MTQIDVYVRRWGLVADGEPIVTHFSQLLPVRRSGVALMLKLLLTPEELSGSKVLQWWDGHRAAAVLEIDEGAILMERALGGMSLAGMVESGRDEDATRILVDVANRLHQFCRPGATPQAAVPLEQWFSALWEQRESDSAVIRIAAEVARELIDHPADEAVLRGDLHHSNVLDFGERGWLAIDPKGLIGERGFEFANLFRNSNPDVATAPGRMDSLAGIISAETGIPEERLLRWVLAMSGLSAAWADGPGPELTMDLAVGSMAATSLQISPGDA